MAEYIERMSAIATACKGCNKEFSNEPCEPSECHIQQGLFNIPSADVAPVVHGRWIEGEMVIDDGVGGYIYHCSECEDWYHAWTPNYCPNCGARMDGDGQ
jgi:predicted amidophosphoribosyltransferase